MNKLGTALTIICVGLADFSFAQGDIGTSSLAAQYTIGIPTGNTKDLVSRLSFRGVTVDYRYHFNDLASIGASVGWSVFYEKEDFDAFTSGFSSGSGETTFTGTQYRYINSVPMLVTFNYFMTRDRIAPFGGVGIGTTYNEYRNLMGQNSLSIRNWHFTVAPEFGVKVNATGHVAGYLSGRYNFSLKGSALNSQSYLGLNIGVMYKL